jgi:hypothetical protein
MLLGITPGVARDYTDLLNSIVNQLSRNSHITVSSGVHQIVAADYHLISLQVISKVAATSALRTM